VEDVEAIRTIDGWRYSVEQVLFFYRAPPAEG
jgi:hypothetical protein